MDLVTHLPTIDRGHDAIYTVVDRLSKFTQFIPCKHIVSAADLAQLFLANVHAHHAGHAITDGPVQSITDHVANMESTIYLVQSSVTHLVAFIPYSAY